MRVIVSGRLRQRNYETRKARSGLCTRSRSTTFGPSLRNASAKVSRAQRSGAGFGGGQGGQGSPGGGRQEDPWASDNGGGYSDEPLF